MNLIVAGGPCLDSDIKVEWIASTRQLIVQYALFLNNRSIVPRNNVSIVFPTNKSMAFQNRGPIVFSLFSMVL